MMEVRVMRIVSEQPNLAPIKFFRMIPTAPSPIAADGTASGTMPLRAYRYCEPLRLASSLGWYIFPPIDFSVLWDGITIRWKCAGLDEWMPLSSAQFPRFSPYFDEHCPDDIRGYAPPFIAAVIEPGMFQLWSGLAVQTKKDWFLMVRPPINLPNTRHASSFEGIIETDKWFGPLFTNFQIKKTDVEVQFRRDEPMFLVHLVQASDVSMPKQFEFSDSIENLSADDWDSYRTTIVERVGVKRVPGSYAVASRKSRKNQVEQ
jgi:Family of unknown function (DUF6065)